MNLEKIVLDSWAVMAWIQAEPAGPMVRDLIKKADGTHLKLFMSSVNLGEVLYLVGRNRGEQAAWDLHHQIRACPIQVVSASDTLVYKAASLKMVHGVGYIDAFGLATALLHEAKFATGDPELKHFSPVPIFWLGE